MLLWVELPAVETSMACSMQSSTLARTSLRDRLDACVLLTLPGSVQYLTPSAYVVVAILSSLDSLDFLLSCFKMEALSTMARRLPLVCNISNRDGQEMQ